MPTLRDRVRETLSAREPSHHEAAGALEAILSRSRRRRRMWPLVVAPALAAAIVGLYLALPRREPQIAVGNHSAQSARGVHLYLHVTGEPNERALTLDLDSKGEL